MRKSHDLHSIQKTLIYIKSMLKTNIAVVLLGKDIALHDFTRNKTIYRHPCDNQGLERFIFDIKHFERALYFLQCAQYDYFDVNKHRDSINYVIEKYGFIPKM